MIGNSTHTYGSITKLFHWLTALLIIIMIPLGIIASRLPYDTPQELLLKSWVFSAHKTLGIIIFFLAVLRIVWAISQPKPGALNANKPFESWLAATVHWLLYASLILVPLSGWLHHSATTGYAPIWPPVSYLTGQSLPLIPKSDRLADIFAGLHITFERVLLIAILLHIAGALKHHIFDKDLTLKRMTPGHVAPDILPSQTKSHVPAFTALASLTAALAIAAALGLFSKEHSRPTTLTLAQPASQWQVQSGHLNLTVTQLGSQITGGFANWTAAISFNETPNRNGLHGEVDVKIAIDSLTLGSVTSQALSPDFLDAGSFPTAEFSSPILSNDNVFTAPGTLKIKDLLIPLTLPFDLEIEGDTARMSTKIVLNRLNLKIGETYPDDGSIGFDVLVDIALTATRAP